ncbi:MAG: hypothetical protein FJY92_06700 [Candidatus Hydrogenedentes bacterium]|nr:hypothetical protein [Candidatus Hydrogenedentota bacterium]
MPAIGVVFVVLGLLSVANGGWMLAHAPTWYDSMPGVTDVGPYNGHFVRDIGLAYAVSGVGFVWCAFNLRRCWPVVVGQALWATGHAVLHVLDMFAGRLPLTHWIVDAPGVLLPGLVLGLLAMPAVWRIVNPQARAAHDATAT